MTDPPVGTRVELPPSLLELLDDGPTAPARARLLAPRRVELVLHEGRKHQVKRMLAAGLVEESQPEDPETGARRKFQLTPLGNGVLAAEVDRLSGVLRHARRSIRLAERRS